MFIFLNDKCWLFFSFLSCLLPSFVFPFSVSPFFFGLIYFLLLPPYLPSRWRGGHQQCVWVWHRSRGGRQSRCARVREVLVAQSCPALCDPMECSPPAPLSMGFSRQEHWSELPCPSPGDLPDPGIEPRSPAL